jgi:hypothetical protein
MDTEQPAGGRRRTLAIVAGAGLACLAIALPVSGAFAEDDGNAGTATPAQYGQGAPYGQGEGSGPQGEAPQGGPDHPCPKDQGGDQSQGNDSSVALRRVDADRDGPGQALANRARLPPPQPEQRAGAGLAVDVVLAVAHARAAMAAVWGQPHDPVAD